MSWKQKTPETPMQDLLFRIEHYLEIGLPLSSETVAEIIKDEMLDSEREMIINSRIGLKNPSDEVIDRNLAEDYYNSISKPNDR